MAREETQSGPSAAAQSLITKTTEQYASFYVGKFLFGVDVMKVQEIIRFQEMTKVPLASEVIEGLINLRGQILTAICMRRRLGLHPRGENELPMNVVVHTSDGAVSLLVDKIGDVLEVQTAQFEPTPVTVDPAVKGLIKGVFKLDDSLLLVLDAEKVIDLSGEMLNEQDE